MSVHTWPFWSCFFSDYCHRVFLFFSPFKRCLRINNVNFIYFDHPSRSCDNFQICFPAQKKLSNQSSPCKKPFWALKTQQVIWVGKFKCSFHFLTKILPYFKIWDLVSVYHWKTSNSGKSNMIWFYQM